MKKPRLISDWRLRLRRSFAVKAAIVGAVAPQVLQVIADQSGQLPWLDENWKGLIRTVSLIAVPVLLVIKQDSLASPDKQLDKPG
jgi:hypothetical protein